MTLYPKLIMDALATVRYPGNGKKHCRSGDGGRQSSH